MQYRLPEVVEVPETFRGWAVVVWGVPGYSAFPTDGSKLIERIPSTGVLITSTPQQFDVASDEFYIIDSSGKRLTQSEGIAEYHAVTGSTKRLHFSEFFVGTLSAADTASSRQADAKIDAIQIHP